MENLFALSIRQPWLDMILRGVKSVEVRSREIRTRGLIALHSPRGIDFDIAYFYGYQSPWLLPRGKIVAVAEITDIRQFDGDSWISELQGHRQPLPFSGGGYGIRLAHVRTLERPISFPGQPMLFVLPQSVASRVLASIQ